jgi:hypothetical protein
METPEDTVEIIGLSAEPVVVKDGEVVHPSEKTGEQDVAAEMKAAVEADKTADKGEAEVKEEAGEEKSRRG